jgi:hypothetical protein
MLNLNIYDTILVLVFSIINILLYYYIYKWINKLEKTGCKCSENWKRTYIKYYTVFIITYIIVSVLYLFITDKNIEVVLSVNFITLIAEIIYIIVSIQYVSELKNIKCECSNDYIRDIILLYSIILASLFGLSLLIGVYVFIILYINNKTYKLNYFMS